MNWNEAVGIWFSLGRQKLPGLERWKELSAVKGAPRTGAILRVDEAVAAAQEASSRVVMTERFLAANGLVNACEAMLSGIGHFDLQAKQRKEAVEELRNRARAARDEFAATAPTIQAILTRPFDVLQLLVGGASEQLLADRVFRNFLSYATVHWRYSATSNFSGEDLLAGRTNQIPCGGLANALKIVLQGVLKDPASVRFQTLSGYLLTKSRYTCFDPLVRGNVRDRTGALDGTCLFNQHYFLTWGGLFFDPCMTAVYLMEGDVIDLRPVPVAGLRTLRVLARAGAGRADSLFILDKTAPVPGFETTYLRVPIAGITDADSLRAAVSPAVAELLRQSPEDAKKLLELCVKAV